MKPIITRSVLISLALASGLYAEPAGAVAAAIEANTPNQEAKTDESKAAEAKEAAKPEKSAEEIEAEKMKAKMKKEQEQLALENALGDERLKHSTAKLRAEISQLKVEKELMAERLGLAAMKRKVDEDVETAKIESERSRLMREASVAKVRAESLTHQLKAAQAEAGIEVARLNGQIQKIEMVEKRKSFANAEPQYLEQPLKANGTLVISDRRIALSGPISGSTADFITDRINYFNNTDQKLPIFIVIDESPGGSVMAGYRILKSMDASKAPIHVVVKSFAASMAAAITTLAHESYAYPNAVILHHQISSMVGGRMNLTQQQEFYKESRRWWDRLATPIADKMGITKEKMIEEMYAHSSSGDWSEFGVEAQKLKWVNHIVTGIEETAILRRPGSEKRVALPTPQRSELPGETLDEEGRPVMYLPRINPKDVYFIYNPDGFYRSR